MKRILVFSLVAMVAVAALATLATAEVGMGQLFYNGSCHDGADAIDLWLFGLAPRFALKEGIKVGSKQLTHRLEVIGEKRGCFLAYMRDI